MNTAIICKCLECRSVYPVDALENNKWPGFYGAKVNNYCCPDPSCGSNDIAYIENHTEAKDVTTYLCFEIFVKDALYRVNKPELVREHANRKRLNLHYNSGESVKSSVDNIQGIIRNATLHKLPNPLKGAHFKGYV